MRGKRLDRETLKVHNCFLKFDGNTCDSACLLFNKRSQCCQCTFGMAGRYAELTKPFQVMDMQKYVNSTKIAPCTLESVSPVSSTLMHTHHRHERARGPFFDGPRPRLSFIKASNQGSQRRHDSGARGSSEWATFRNLNFAHSFPCSFYAFYAFEWRKRRFLSNWTSIWNLAEEYRDRLKGLYVVARSLILLLLTCSAWPCLGPA